MNSVMHMVSLSLSDAIITDDYYVQNVTAQRTTQYSHRYSDYLPPMSVFSP